MKNQKKYKTIVIKAYKVIFFMPAIEIGRICLIKKGKNTGKKAKISSIIDDNTVELSLLENNKKEKISIRHIEPLE